MLVSLFSNESNEIASKNVKSSENEVPSEFLASRHAIFYLDGNCKRRGVRKCSNASRVEFCRPGREKEREREKRWNPFFTERQLPNPDLHLLGQPRSPRRYARISDNVHCVLNAFEWRPDASLFRTDRDDSNDLLRSEAMLIFQMTKRYARGLGRT